MRRPTKKPFVCLSAQIMYFMWNIFSHRFNVLLRAMRQCPDNYKKIGLWHNCSNILQGPRWTPDFNPTGQDLYLMRTTLKAKRPTNEQQLKAASGLPKHFWGGNSVFGDIRLFQTWHFSLYFKNIFIASWTLCIEGKTVSLSKHNSNCEWNCLCVCVCTRLSLRRNTPATDSVAHCVLIFFFFWPYIFLSFYLIPFLTKQTHPCGYKLADSANTYTVFVLSEYCMHD